MPSENGSGFHDPAFASNKLAPLHRWVPWIAGFSSAFVQSAFRRFLPGPGRVLDPFAGVGTTLVEAVLAGHEAVGFEINPYAALSCRTKLNAYKVSVNDLEIENERFEWVYSEWANSDHAPHSKAPEGFNTRGVFYSPLVLRKVLLLLDYIDTIKDPEIKELYRLAFSSTMVKYSNYSYEPSLGQRSSAGRPNVDDFPVVDAILGKLTEIAEDIQWFQAQLHGRPAKSQVFNKSFLDCRQYLDEGSIDLLVTSPPYLNNYHYNRNTRPHLYWLGYVEKPQDMVPIENASFGKYWQTVRDQERLDLVFKLPGSDIAKRLEQLRSLNPEKGVYGGNGWANYAASYFNDCYHFAKSLSYVLRPGGHALVVIGNSILQGVQIPTDRYLADIAESVGMECVDIEIPRSKRVGNSIIQSDVRVAKAETKQNLYEAVVILRRP